MWLCAVGCNTLSLATVAICRSAFIVQVRALEREDQLRSAMAAEDEMLASLAGRTRASAKESDTTDPQARARSLTLAKIKQTSAIEQALAKVDARKVDIKEYSEKAIVRAQKLVETGHDSSKEVANAIKQEITAKLARCNAYLEGEVEAKLRAVLSTCAAAQSVAELETMKASFTELCKSMNKNATEELILFVKKFNQTAGSICRDGAVATKREKPQPPDAPKHPLWIILMENLKDKCFVNMTDSIFEAKGGLRAAALVATNGNVYDKLVAQPVLKKALRTIDTAIKRGVKSCVAGLVAGSVIVKRFDELVQQTLSPEVRSKCALPKAPWATKIFEIEAFGSDAADSNALWPNYGMMQCVLVLKGDVVFMGVKSEAIPGQTFHDKRVNLLRMNSEDIGRLLVEAKSSWLIRFDDGVTAEGHCGVLIPSGFCILSATSNARCIRWPLVADNADFNRVRSTMQQMLDSFAEYKSSHDPHVQLAKHFGLRL